MEKGKRKLHLQAWTGLSQARGKQGSESRSLQGKGGKDRAPGPVKASSAAQEGTALLAEEQMLAAARSLGWTVHHYTAAPLPKSRIQVSLGHLASHFSSLGSCLARGVYLCSKAGESTHGAMNTAGNSQGTSG